MTRLILELRAAGATVDIHANPNLITINREFSAYYLLAKCHEHIAETPRWRIRLRDAPMSDLIVAARLCPGNQKILDYYILPTVSNLRDNYTIALKNSLALDVYRFENLNLFINMARRAGIEETYERESDRAHSYIGNSRDESPVP